MSNGEMIESLITELPQITKADKKVGTLTLSKEGELVLTYHEQKKVKVVLHADPETFQFRSKIKNRDGEVGTLFGCQEWDYRLSGDLEIYKAADKAEQIGRHDISDGHQRRGLAKRYLHHITEQLDKAGNAPKQIKKAATIEISFFLLKEEKRWTPRKAMVAGAIKNMAQNNAHPMDIALALKKSASESLLSAHVPPRSIAFDHGRCLAKLDDEIFKAVLNGGGGIPLDLAIAIGKYLPDDFPAQDSAIKHYRQMPKVRRPRHGDLIMFVEEFRDSWIAGEIGQRQCELDLFDDPVSAENMLFNLRLQFKQQVVSLLTSFKTASAKLAQHPERARKKYGYEVDASLHRNTTREEQLMKEVLLREFKLRGSVCNEMLADYVVEYGRRNGNGHGALNQKVLEDLARDFVDELEERPELIQLFEQTRTKNLQIP